MISTKNEEQQKDVIIQLEAEMQSMIIFNYLRWRSLDKKPSFELNWLNGSILEQEFDVTFLKIAQAGGWTLDLLVFVYFLSQAVP